MYTLIVFSVLYFLFGYENYCRCPNLKQVYFLFSFYLGLRPRFSRKAASPLACLGFVCSNFAKKNKRLLAV